MAAMREDHGLWNKVAKNLQERSLSWLMLLIAPAAAGFLVAGCGGGQTTLLNPNVPPVTNGDWYRPGVATSWQWQLQADAGGEINTNYSVDVYDIDLFEVSEAQIQQLQDDGRKVICHFSAGSYEDFRVDAGEFDPADYGNTL